MHRAKHRADGDAAVLATTLIERFAVVPGPRPDPTPTGGDLFGAARHSRPRTGATPVVPAPRLPALPFSTPSLSSLPSLPTVRIRPQPVGAAISATVLGAAAAVTAVAGPVAPPTAIETTGSLAPVQQAGGAAQAPTVGPVLPGRTLAAALPDQPTMQINALVGQVTAQMQKVEPAVAKPYTTVANKTELSSPAAMRKAALTNAMSKLGKPYRWGAVGPNSFDCSGLVKFAFDRVGKKLPRTSRAQATVGTAVRKADLQPGDLVFFYQPISHVGIYIGNGKIVHASRTGQPVKISDMSRMRFTTARRV